MQSRRLSVAALVYAWAVILAGAGVGLGLLLTGDPTHWKWAPLAVFGSLAVASSVVTLGYRGHLQNGVVYQIGSSFLYPLFLLVDPGALCVVLWVVASADWALHRRHALTGLFNMTQWSLALGAAVLVRELLPGGAGLPLDPSSLALAAVPLLVYSQVNELLTQIVINLVNGHRWYRIRPTGTGLLSELLCVASGLCMAVLWVVQPGLLPLGVFPLAITTWVLFLFARRESELASRETELHSLQGLGLEIGSELEAERLQRAVVRIATDALEASGALLAVVDSTGEKLLVQAHRGLRPAPPAELPLSRFADGFFETGTVRLVEDFLAQRDVYPELTFLDARGLLCAPLEILGRREGLLVLTRGERRVAFDADDVQNLETLVRFVNVALSNARLVEDIRQMQEQLIHSEKMSALGMLVSGVSHELNNPLTSVMGFTELLLAREQDPSKLRMLEKVHGQARRAERLVQNLLSFSRKHKTESRPCDLNELLDQVLELREQTMGGSGIEVIRRLTPGLPPVQVDPHQLQQVFLNLVTNADHALEGRPGPRRIVVESRYDDDAVSVTISDNGPGIAPADLDKVFLPFFTTKRPGRGTGLGLSICYGIVKDHGGRITVESPPGDGARFRVEIPTAPRRARDVATTRGPIVLPARGGRLLVVDDEDTIVQLVTAYMEPRGWSVTCARDGAEALKMLSVTTFDVLIVDVLMPGMDGREFFDELRRSRPELASRVVFATGAGGHKAVAEFLHSLRNPVLGKPYDLATLADAVTRVAGEGPLLH